MLHVRSGCLSRTCDSPFQATVPSIGLRPSVVRGSASITHANSRCNCDATLGNVVPSWIKGTCLRRQLQGSSAILRCAVESASFWKDSERRRISCGDRSVNNPSSLASLSQVLTADRLSLANPLTCQARETWLCSIHHL